LRTGEATGRYWRTGGVSGRYWRTGGASESVVSTAHPTFSELRAWFGLVGPEPRGASITLPHCVIASGRNARLVTSDVSIDTDA
jgi:hypothetical protein